jgi:hypothetical protein
VCLLLAGLLPVPAAILDSYHDISLLLEKQLVLELEVGITDRILPSLPN